MRRFVIVAGVLPLMAGCGHPVTSPVPAPPSCASLREAQGADSSAAEGAVIASLRGRARRSGERLELTLPGGKPLLLHDSTGEAVAADAQIRYRLVALQPALHAYVVDVALWEGSATLLVDTRSGRRTVTWGHPLLAPGGRRFVASSYDLEARYNPNGIQVWRVAGDSLALEWKLEPKDWGPSQAAWLDATTLLVVRNYGPARQATSNHSCALARYRHGGWAVQEVRP